MVIRVECVRMPETSEYARGLQNHAQTFLTVPYKHVGQLGKTKQLPIPSNVGKPMVITLQPA